ncbi:MAG: MoaF N-terminal domain-containing protein [Dehalococcoidales bacterium]|nr:MoaF N-terminal domain-containing protein [Dehalococcoidales bacterium]
MKQTRAQNWIDLEDWGKGMSEFRLPRSNELTGIELNLHFAAGDSMLCKFHNESTLSWESPESSDKEQPEIETYEAIRVASDIFFVDFVRSKQPGISISMALDLKSGKTTVIQAILPDRTEACRDFLDRVGKGIDLSTIKIEIKQACVNPLLPDIPVKSHERTSELVGKRMKYTYSNNHIYEHIYLNERLFTWHCLAGLERGLADTEICDYFKIVPDIYLFIWCEKVMPTFGAVLINFKEMRSNGKSFGLDIRSGRYINFTMGAYVEAIGQTSI